MMGHRGLMKTGDEFDALTQWKRVLNWRGGERKRQKRAYNKRQRKCSKQKLKKYK